MSEVNPYFCITEPLKIVMHYFKQLRLVCIIYKVNIQSLDCLYIARLLLLALLHGNMFAWMVVQY